MLKFLRAKFEKHSEYMQILRISC